ncbi:MAG TPA: monovalent cation:proton antiporter-2 (CPA2) family protein [Deltaproteobacteria bacterium]|nr:monovalent cation:proton antiporter-2 (CPA2) family protein [Deltaproteobacteria bacterium]
MMTGFFGQAIIYLTAAIVCVPIAKRLGMGSVLGYLLAGIIIGPFGLGFIGREGQDIMHFAEFGVVMMLFLIGLELEPAHFWKMRHLVVGMGALQIGATAVLTGAVLMLLGLTWQAALAAGLALAMSSTAIVLQSLKEKGLGGTMVGKSAFAVLLSQDIAVIPILALLPLLAVSTGHAAGASHGQSFLEDLPGWLQTLAVLGAGASVVVAGRFLVAPVLRIIARTHLREIFTAAALLIVLATALLMSLVGLSPALGAFLAGVVLANSEFRHELESDIEPFKGLLLGLFFIAVGASINFRLIGQEPLFIGAFVLAVVLIKTLVLGATGRLFKLTLDQNVIFTLSLSQVGEFAFVLFSFMRQARLLSDELSGQMMAVTALSMALTPVLLLIGERLVLPRLITPQVEDLAADAIDTRHRVIIAGFGEFGSTIGRFLRANGVEATILDNDSSRVDLLRKMSFKVFYGDATRLDILKSAGAEEARLLIVALADPVTRHDLIEKIRSHYPDLKLMVKTKDRADAYDLIDAGIQDVYRESLDTSIRLGVDALIRLGHRRYSAARAGLNFLKYDEAALRELAKHRHDEKLYIETTREYIRQQEQLLANDREANPTINDHAWESDRHAYPSGKT